MKSIIIIIILAITFTLSAEAQYKSKADSLIGDKTTNATTHTRGYGNWQWMYGRTAPDVRSDAQIWPKKTFTFTFTNTTDSIRIYGVGMRSASSTIDTVKVPIPLTWKISGINTGAGSAVIRDTVAYWVTSRANCEAGTPHWYDLSQYPFKEYLIVTGKNDSGYVRWEIRDVK